jgi:hypothetical protein
MLSPLQIFEFAQMVLESGVELSNHDDVNEYIRLLLENVSGFECITDDELIQLQVLIALKKC